MEIAPKIVAKEMYRSDTSEWLTQASISVKTATISRIKVTAEPRPYVQKFRTVKMQPGSALYLSDKVHAR